MKWPIVNQYCETCVAFREGRINIFYSVYNDEITLEHVYSIGDTFDNVDLLDFLDEVAVKTVLPQLLEKRFIETRLEQETWQHFDNTLENDHG